MRWWLLLLVGICVAITVPALLLSDNVLVAFAVGLADATVLWVMALWIIEATGSTTWRLGAEGEQWTADELQKLGPGWQSVHAVGIGAGDVDHVVMGPAGVFALETKRTSGRWSRRDPKTRRLLESALDQAWRNRQAVRLRLRNHVGAIEVTPVVVLWGRCDDGVTDPDSELPVVHGSELVAWLRGRPSLLVPDLVDRAAAGLRDYVGSLRETREGAPRFVEVGATGIVRDVAAGASGGILGILLAALVLAIEEAPIALRLGGVAMLALAGGTVRRWGRGRARIAGLGVGVAATAMLTIIGVLTFLLLVAS
jgi:hypothetical protein